MYSSCISHEDKAGLKDCIDSNASAVDASLYEGNVEGYTRVNEAELFLRRVWFRAKTNAKEKNWLERSRSMILRVHTTD